MELSNFLVQVNINTKSFRIICSINFFQHNPFSANIIKWSNTLKQFVGNLPTNCLSVFDHFVRLALKGIIYLVSVGIRFFNVFSLKYIRGLLRTWSHKYDGFLWKGRLAANYFHTKLDQIYLAGF